MTYAINMLNDQAEVGEPAPLQVFASRLQERRTLAGGPSLRVLERLTSDLGNPYSRTAIDTRLKGTSKPDWKFTETFVRACARYSGRETGSADLDSWRKAYQHGRSKIV